MHELVEVDLAKGRHKHPARQATTRKEFLSKQKTEVDALAWGHVVRGTALLCHAHAAAIRVLEAADAKVTELGTLLHEQHVLQQVRQDATKS